MRFKIDIDGDLEQLMKAEKHRMGLATTLAVRSGGETLKGLWRRQVVGAGLGQRLANTVRHEAFPKKGFSYNPAGVVFTKAEKIIDAFEHGSLIRAASGVWLAIPLPAAGKYKGGRKPTPGEWQFRTGRLLRFVINRARGTAFLVADDARVSTVTGLASARRGRRRKDGILTGAQTVPIFALVRQVKMPKKLDLMADATTVEAMLPNLIVQRWAGLRGR